MSPYNILIMHLCDLHKQGNIKEGSYWSMKGPPFLKMILKQNTHDTLREIGDHTNVDIIILRHLTYSHKISKMKIL